jgi:hypothetical protein
MLRILSPYVGLALGLMLTGACAEPECPDGFDQVGKLCRDAGAGASPAIAGDGSLVDDAGAVGDAAVHDLDAVVATASSDAGGSAQTPLDASPVVGVGSDAAMTIPQGDAATSNQPAGECDNDRPCSAGYSCMSAKCVSACEQKRCDTNATCALVAGAAVCTCNRGFIAQGSGDTMTCAADVACEQLGCDTNSRCSVGADMLRHCTCNAGFTGTGMSCTPVSCIPLTLPNGTVTGGTTNGSTATHRCNTGYRFAPLVGNETRRCGPDMTWTGTAPRCDPISCGVPPTVPNATVSPRTAGTFGATATYACTGGATTTDRLTITCEAGGWTTEPTCTVTAVCGNGTVERFPVGQEECDWGVAIDKWSCSQSGCKRQTIYTPCWSHSDCGTGELCSQLGYCTKTCSTPSIAQCPAVPAGITLQCNGNCTLLGCRTAADCPDGLTCFAPGGAGGAICTTCTNSTMCPSGTTCLDSGNMPVEGGGRFGRCRR